MRRRPPPGCAPTSTTSATVHGYGGDNNSWLFVQEPLAARHTVYALDLPGHGESGKEVGDGSLASLAAVVTDFLDALGIERAHLVGHSLGGGRWSRRWRRRYLTGSVP
ncbi:alpha/beta fold hydrolase [Streptomyces sp. NPDC050147]|uniref:alpha/beta fold hydrolase n=1 Tax=Streptomyces sp. NPDC050147 TaxID=3155513 RepID=UPI003444DA7D